MSESEEYRRDTREILALVTPRFENAEAAYEWFSTEPLPGFSGSTAMDLIRAGRVSAVIDYIKAVDAGIYS